MKRLIITVDKVALWFFILCVPLGIVNMYFFSIDLKLSFAEYGMKLNSTPVFVILAICGLVVYAVIMDQLVAVINLKEDKIGFGIFNLGKIGYPEIKKVQVGNKLELHTDNKIKYINILSFDNNKEKYMSLLEFLDEKIHKRIKPDGVFGSLTQYENTKFKTNKGAKLGIGGLLILPAMALVAQPFSTIISLIRQSSGNTLTLNIFNGFISILCIFTAIYFFSRKPVAVTLLKIYYSAYAIGSIIVNYTDIIFGTRQISALPILGSLTGIIYVFLVFRYLNTSKRVKATFVN